MNNQQEFPIFKHLDQAQVETVKQMDRLYSKNNKGPQKATARTLHFYGQFTGELPEKFQPAGPYGHQYIKCTSIDEAEARCQELRSFIFSQWPDAMEWASDGWYRWMIHDLRQLTLQFE